METHDCGSSLALKTCTESPEGGLLGNNVITLHKEHLINYYKDNRLLEQLLDWHPEKIELAYQLSLKGYPKSSLLNFLKCGEFIRYGDALKMCPNHGILERISLTHHCSLRNCPVCSKIRKKKIRHKWLPILQKYPLNHAPHRLIFITISPANYEDCSKGMAELKKGFARLKRNSYWEDRVRGGLAILESKYNPDLQTWHHHLHIIIYSKFLDNKIRGYCRECGQNLLKKDNITKKYYCANRKCNSTNVKLKNTNSALTEVCRLAFKRECNVDITKIDSYTHLMNYLLVYLGAPKDNFAGLVDKEAEFMVHSLKKRLISSFGVFYNVPLTKENPPTYCPICGEKCFWIIDWQVLKVLDELAKPPPKDLFYYIPEIK